MSLIIGAAYHRGGAKESSEGGRRSIPMVLVDPDQLRLRSFVIDFVLK